MNRKHIIAIACLAAALVAALTIGGASYANGQADDRRVAETAAATDKRAALVRAGKLADDELDDAVASAVKSQKARDTRILRRVVRKMKVAARRKINEAYKKGQRNGYASGNAAGYSSGNSAGYREGAVDGLLEGSDDLTCSDDPDVTWLPFCY